MNIYVITRTDDVGYDEYSGAVVVAKSAKDAATISPTGDYLSMPSSWEASKLKIVFIGKASKGTQRGLVLSAFEAG